MKNLFILITLIFFTSNSSLKAQNIFKGKIWCCVKSLDKGERSADKTNGELKGVNITHPEFQFTIDFRTPGNNQQFVRYDNSGKIDFSGKWEYSGTMITLIPSDNIHTKEDLTIIILGNSNFVLLRDKKKGMTYYMACGN